MRMPSERQFFLLSALWYLIVVFWGFAPSFYLSRFYIDSESLPLHLIIHGVAFTIWTILYAVQVVLIRTNRFEIHKILGVFGLVVMLVMIPTGIFPSIYKVYAGTTSVDSAGHNVFRLGTGYVLFGLAYFYRKKSFYHKRLMLGCMVMLMSAAIFRISFDFNMQSSQIFNKGFQVLPAVMLFLFDYLKFKKFVWVDLISVLAVLAIFFFADYFWLSSFGDTFMDFLITIFVKPFV